VVKILLKAAGIYLNIDDGLMKFKFSGVIYI